MSDNRLKIQFKQVPDYKRFHVTGFYGGITPDGQKLNIELYEDSFEIPNVSYYVIEPNTNRIKSEEPEPPQANLTRFVHAGITIPITQLPSIIDWLKSKYDEYLNNVGLGGNTNR